VEQSRVAENKSSPPEATNAIDVNLLYVRETCTHFIKQLPIGISILFRHEIFLMNKIQLDATYYFLTLMLGSTCFGHHYAHHQELTTIAFGYHIGRLVLELLLVGS